MAINIGALKLPFLGRSADPGEPVGAKPGAAAGRLWLIGHLPIGRQLQVLIGALVLLLGAVAALVVFDTRQGTFGTIYIASVGKLQMLSQRLAKAAQQASQGNAEAFNQLRSSRDEFASIVKLLAFGGTTAGVDLPPTPLDVQPSLNALDRNWGKTEGNAALVIDEERNLVALGSAVRAINANNPVLQELTDEIAALSVQKGGSARQNAITAQLTMLTQRMAKNANIMLAEDIVDPEVAFLLGKDTNTYRDTVQGLLQGSDALRIARVSDAEMRGKLGELQAAFADYQRAVSDILGNQARLVGAKRAAFDIFNDSVALLRSAEGLNAAFEADLAKRRFNFIALGVLSLLALGVLALIGLVYVSDSRRRAEDSERQNRANQQAILRLLDEIGSLADGDLTSRAQVTEEITGAIADSIN
jgi:twitching motility protein PilJ